MRSHIKSLKKILIIYKATGNEGSNSLNLEESAKRCIVTSKSSCFRSSNVAPSEATAASTAADTSARSNSGTSTKRKM